MISISDSVQASRNRLAQCIHELRELESDLAGVASHMVAVKKRPVVDTRRVRNPNISDSDPAVDLAKVKDRLRKMITDFDRVAEMMAARRTELEQLLQ